MSYLSLANKIRNDQLTDNELVECLDIKNVSVLQHTILKIIKKEIKGRYICDKLVEISELMGPEFKILGPCKLGHLAIYALEKLGYDMEYQKLYSRLPEVEKEPIEMLKKAL